MACCWRTFLSSNVQCRVEQLAHGNPRRKAHPAVQGSRGRNFDQNSIPLPLQTCQAVIAGFTLETPIDTWWQVICEKILTRLPAKPVGHANGTGKLIANQPVETGHLLWMVVQVVRTTLKPWLKPLLVGIFRGVKSETTS